MLPQTFDVLVRSLLLDLRVDFGALLVVQRIATAEFRGAIRDKCSDEFRVVLAVLGLDPAQKANIGVGRRHNAGFNEGGAGAMTLAQEVAVRHRLSFDPFDPGGSIHDDEAVVVDVELRDDLFGVEWPVRHVRIFTGISFGKIPKERFGDAECGLVNLLSSRADFVFELSSGHESLDREADDRLHLAVQVGRLRWFTFDDAAAQEAKADGDRQPLATNVTDDELFKLILSPFARLDVRGK